MGDLSTAILGVANAMRPADCGSIVIKNPTAFYEVMSILAARAKRLETALDQAEWNLAALRDAPVDIELTAGADPTADALDWLRTTHGADAPLSPGERQVSAAIIHLDHVLNHRSGVPA